MNTNAPKSSQRWLRLGTVLIALAASSCMNVGRPTAEDLRTKDGHDRAVVLIRMVTEIDGRKAPVFTATYANSSIWLGLGGFSTGGKLQVAPLRFFSKETRLDGWTYLLLEPGVHYLAPHPGQNTDAVTYDNSWKKTSPRWRFEVPRNVPVVYVGTLFAPGRGQWVLFGDRALYEFEENRFEVRDESVAAEAIHETWLKDLGSLTTKLAVNHSSSEPIILETPPGR
jgi:hypothetical protein